MILNTLDKSGTDGADCCKKVLSGMKVTGAVRSLENAWSLCTSFIVSE